MKRMLPHVAALGAGLMIIAGSCSRQNEATLTESGLDPAKFAGEYNGKPVQGEVCPAS